MAELTSELSSSGTAWVYKAGDGIQNSTVFGSAITDTHQFTGSLYVSGTIVANSYQVVTFTNANVVSTGSTTFGDSSDDIHQLTGSVGISGSLTVGIDGDGHDVIFYSDTAGDKFQWDASEEKLIIIGTNGQIALDVQDGDLSVVDEIYAKGGLTLGAGGDEYTIAEASDVITHTVAQSNKDLIFKVAPGGTATEGYRMIGTSGPKHTFYGSVTTHLTGNSDPVSLSDNTGVGNVIYFGTGSTTLGLLYFLNTDGGWTAANANATGSLVNTGGGNASLLGMALGTSPLANGMLIQGFFDATAAYSEGWVKGGAVYVISGAAGDAGKISGSAPTAADSYVRIVGYCTDTPNVIYFNPDSTWVENS